VELFQEIVSRSGNSFDVNYQDGLGNTALHYAAASCSTSILPELLEQEVDVDLHNRLEGNTPLHEALKIEDEEARQWVGECKSLSCSSFSVTLVGASAQHPVSS
jgi:uncharacterized protein